MSYDAPYSLLDRAVHRLAFASPDVQAAAADVESALFGKRFRHLAVERPIFVTSLPRAGTTLVLEILSAVPGIATHKYRDMPFVLAPLLWDALSRGFRRPSELRERAHGDGMDVGYDSPEAFEEILWRASWPAKYGPESIGLWSARDASEAFGARFVDHMRKIIALRSGDAGAARYASKNNANVARLPLLRKLFPDAVIVVPLREPLAQAASLLRQHRRFAAMHDTVPFSRRYMEDVGHLEFGALHRPIDFEGMREARARYRPDGLDYWLAYWVCAFRHLYEHRREVVLVSYEALCAAGPRLIPALAEPLAIPAGELVGALGSRLRAPRERDAGPADAEERLVREARELYRQLLEAAIGGPQSAHAAGSLAFTAS